MRSSPIAVTLLTRRGALRPGSAAGATALALLALGAWRAGRRGLRERARRGRAAPGRRFDERGELR